MKANRILVILGAVVLVWWLTSSSQTQAGIGETAPDFTLTDHTGGERSLSDYRGRFVVLEWFNDDCPFVKKHYTSGNMQGLQSTYTEQDVMWLTIASSASGRQGYIASPQEATEIIEQRDSHQTVLLLDPAGAVGRLYGAKTTPHMFIIDPDGLLIYAGAIDDTPSTDPADVPQATNYVQLALDAAMAGQPVPTPTTKSYGCSVKY